MRRVSISNDPKPGHTLRGCVDWNLHVHEVNHIELVTPYVGVWIETTITSSFAASTIVTPYVGVWIETTITSSFAASTIVTPYVGVWIETMEASSYTKAIMCHTLRGCVDWNKKDQRENLVVSVTPYVGVWIETLNLLRHSLVY